VIVVNILTNTNNTEKTTTGNLSQSKQIISQGLSWSWSYGSWI